MASRPPGPQMSQMGPAAPPQSGPTPPTGGGQPPGLPQVPPRPGAQPQGQGQGGDAVIMQLLQRIAAFGLTPEQFIQALDQVMMQGGGQGLSGLPQQGGAPPVGGLGSIPSGGAGVVPLRR